jgi:NAD(P)H-dependent flavin oxidoreductase YrpB (nitropropane dioxygenase family)
MGGWIAGPELAAAVSNAGGLGTLGLAVLPTSSDAMRERTLPLIAQEPEVVPKHLGGPDLPCDETVRCRFFGEEGDVF